MPRRRRRSKGKERGLTYWQEMELIFGPDGEGRSAFTSPIYRRSGWFRHRGELIEGHNAGQRPWGWWAFESGCKPPYPTGTEEARELERLGVLEEEEIAELAAWARIRGGPGVE